MLGIQGCIALVLQLCLTFSVLEALVKHLRGSHSSGNKLTGLRYCMVDALEALQFYVLSIASGLCKRKHVCSGKCPAINAPPSARHLKIENLKIRSCERSRERARKMLSGRINVEFLENSKQMCTEFLNMKE